MRSPDGRRRLMPAFRALWDIDMGARRIAPGERLDLDQDDPALPGLLASGVLEPIRPAPAAEGTPGEVPPETTSERAPVPAPMPAPMPARVEAGAPAPRKPVRGRQRAG